MRKLYVVVAPESPVFHSGHVLKWCREIGVIHLAQYEGGEFVPGAVSGIHQFAGCIVASSLVVVEVEISTGVYSPTGLRESHVTEFAAGLDRVFSGRPTHVIEELITV